MLPSNVHANNICFPTPSLEVQCTWIVKKQKKKLTPGRNLFSLRWSLEQQEQWEEGWPSVAFQRRGCGQTLCTASSCLLSPVPVTGNGWSPPAAWRWTHSEHSSHSHNSILSLRTSATEGSWHHNLLRDKWEEKFMNNLKVMVLFPGILQSSSKDQKTKMTAQIQHYHQVSYFRRDLLQSK